MDPLTAREERRAALGLSETDALGAIRYRELVDRHGSARQVLARAGAIAASGAVPPSVAAGLRAARPAGEERMERLRARGIRLVAYGGPGYPDSLRHLHAPPPVLYLTGPGELPVGRAVAVVGTRSSTSYGRRVTRDLAAGLALAGCTVVSGMARGIDGAAHRAALDAAGATVGVLGTGLDHIYPRIHRSLFARMREAGLLVSEFPPAEPARRVYFPRRNRIIAALAQAVVVVQAGEGSGALITSGQAMELGREIFAVPGPVGPAASVGVHRLLRDGAAPATCAEDVLVAMKWTDGDGSPDDPAGRDRRAGPSRDRLAGLLGRDAAVGAAVCAALVEGPRDADDLARETGLDAPAAAGLLGRLELEGIVRGLPGGRFALEPFGPADEGDGPPDDRGTAGSPTA